MLRTSLFLLNAVTALKNALVQDSATSGVSTTPKCALSGETCDAAQGEAQCGWHHRRRTRGQDHSPWKQLDHCSAAALDLLQTRCAKYRARRRPGRVFAVRIRIASQRGALAARHGGLLATRGSGGSRGATSNGFLGETCSSGSRGGGSSGSRGGTSTGGSRAAPTQQADAGRGGADFTSWWK